MKRFITVLACLVFALTLFAQENNSRLNVRKLELVPRDTEGSVARKVDGNEKPCALIKIQTPNMNEAERNKLEFYADRGTFVYPHKAVGEVKLYLTFGCKTLIIMHPDYGKLVYDMPISVEGYKTYEMVLDANKEFTSAPIQVNSNWVLVKVTPADAIVTIDGKFCSGQTMLSVGDPHSLVVKHGLYHDYEQTIYASAKETKVFTVNMTPAFGSLYIDSKPESGAIVMLNGRRAGVTPYRRDTIPSGEYEVSLFLDMYESLTKTVRVRDNNASEVEFAMKPSFAMITVVTDDDVDIYIDNEPKGKGSWTGRLSEGKHMAEARKASHHDSRQAIDLKAGDNKTVTLASPAPIYGGLSISTEPFEAAVYLDGNRIGTSPMLQSNVLIGRHTIAFEKEGYRKLTKEVVVTEQQVLDVRETLERGKEITFYSSIKNVAVFADDVYYGILPLNAEKSAELNIPEDYQLGDDFAAIKAKAEQGDAAAQNNLGQCYFIGKGVDKNDTIAFYWFKESAKNGNHTGQTNLARCLCDGYGTEVNDDEGYKWATKAAVDNKNAAAVNLMGTFYAAGKYVKQDSKEAAKWYTEASKSGFMVAQTNIGDGYLSGDGVKKNYKEALRWYQKAADQGYVRAQVCIGYCYEMGYGVKKDNAEALKWYRKAADQDYDYAETKVAYFYHYGQGVTQDYAEALKWYHKAADQGYAWAINNIGYCYNTGAGVDKNLEEAVNWYRKAADHGYSVAQYNLGVCYYHGHGVNKDYEEAVKWYRVAAEKGYADAQNNLGYCYAMGNGVKQDYKEAKKWYKKAAAQGNERAKQNLKNLRY